MQGIEAYHFKEEKQFGENDIFPQKNLFVRKLCFSWHSYIFLYFKQNLKLEAEDKKSVSSWKSPATAPIPWHNVSIRQPLISYSSSELTPGGLFSLMFFFLIEPVLELRIYSLCARWWGELFSIHKFSLFKPSTVNPTYKVIFGIYNQCWKLITFFVYLTKIGAYKKVDIRRIPLFCHLLVKAKKRISDLFPSGNYCNYGGKNSFSNVFSWQKHNLIVKHIEQFLDWEGFLFLTPISNNT